MASLLYLRSSIFHGEGASSRLSDRFVRRWAQANPDGKVVSRNVNAPLLPHLEASAFLAFRVPPDQQTPEQQAELRLSDELVQELLSADVLVIGAPMYNFGVSSALKAWIDHITRPGFTFRYTEAGPVGMIENVSRCLIFSTRGGFYDGSPLDTQLPYLKSILQFMGIPAPEVVVAEGLAVPDLAGPALEQAELAIDQMAV